MEVASGEGTGGENLTDFAFFSNLDIVKDYLKLNQNKIFI